MPSPDPLFAIVFDKLSGEREEVVHELVKEKCNGWWWHRFPLLWIVGGNSASYWRDLMRPIVSGTGSEVLVMTISQSEFHWAAMGPTSKFQWLHDAFGTEPPDED